MLCRQSLRYWILKRNSKITGMYLSSKSALPFFPFQQLQIKQRQVCCKSWAKVWNLGMEAQRKECLQRKTVFLSRRVWNVQPFSKASWQNKKLQVGQMIRFLPFVTNGASFEAKLQICSTKDWNSAEMQSWTWSWALWQCPCSSGQTPASSQTRSLLLGFQWGLEIHLDSINFFQ